MHVCVFLCWSSSGPWRNRSFYLNQEWLNTLWSIFPRWNNGLSLISPFLYPDTTFVINVVNTPHTPRQSALKTGRLYFHMRNNIDSAGGGLEGGGGLILCRCGWEESVHHFCQTLCIEDESRFKEHSQEIWRAAGLFPQLCKEVWPEEWIKVIFLR